MTERRRRRSSVPRCRGRPRREGWKFPARGDRRPRRRGRRAPRRLPPCPRRNSTTVRTTRWIRRAASPIRRAASPPFEPPLGFHPGRGDSLCSVRESPASVPRHRCTAFPHTCIPPWCPSVRDTHGYHCVRIWYKHQRRLSPGL